MPLWDKLRTELDRAGRAAQGAIDEGKIRLEAYRARQLADKAAQALGYAVYRARKDQRELEPDIYARLSSTLAAHEAEAERLEAQLRDVQGSRREEWAAAGSTPHDRHPGAGSSGAGSAGGTGGASGADASGSPGATSSGGGASSSSGMGQTPGAGESRGPESAGPGHQPL